MKKFKKIMAVVAAMAMTVAMGFSAVAQTKSGNGGEGSITISNAAKGETYSVYKLFDAKVTGTENGSIAYTGEIPASLANYFSKDGAGNILATEAAKNDDSMSDGLKAALKAWAETATPIVEAVSDGSALTFDKIPYGYYVVGTTQGKEAISVDSTNPSAKIVDKNTTTPTDVVKSVDDDDVYIGQTVTYMVKFKTANYNGAGEGAKQIQSYTIHDTLPGFLSDVNVTKIFVDDDANLETTEDQTQLTVQQFNEDKKINIPWVDRSTSLYKNGTTLFITYTAKVTDSAAIAGTGNTNEVTVTFTDSEGSHDVGHSQTTIKTYAIAIKKVDDQGHNLAGAKFQFPFYVKNTAADDGAYIYAGTTAGDGLTNTITTPESGEITVKGLESGNNFSIEETEAPSGYNKLTTPVKVTPVKTSETTTSKTWKIKDGEIVDDSVETTITTTYNNEKLAATPIAVINKTGAALPTTGGMGTTILYVAGAILVIAGAAVLVIKKRHEA